jgi:tricorn protease interacting factor F2/3
MSADSLSTTHPIQVKVDTVNEIQQVFDAISYGKGASILRMVETYIGEAAFRRGVSAYLRKFRYSNARGEDLWKSMANASGKPVGRVMGAWITQRGFPVVKVSAEGNDTRLSQSRFLVNGKESKASWPIPLTYVTHGKSRSLLFDRPTMTLKGVNAGALQLNLGRRGFYAVLYDEETYNVLARRFHSFHPHDKAGMMTDLWLFMQAGKVKPETYFRFLSLCGRFTQALVIDTVTSQLLTLRAIADEAPAVKSAYENFYFPVAAAIGLEPRPGEDPNLGTAREGLMAQVVQVNADFARRLSERFSDFDNVEPDLKQAVATSYAVVNGGSAYGPMVARIKTASEVDRRKLYAALTASPDPSVVEKTLDLSIGGEVSRSDSGYTITGAANNPNARQVTWNWLSRRYDEVKATYGGAQQFYLYLDRAIPRCAIGRTDEVKAFLSGRRFEEGKLTFRRTFERLEVYSRLRETLLAV